MTFVLEGGSHHVTVYLLRRLSSTLILLMLVVTLVFLLIHILPGDPALTILGGVDSVPEPAAVERVRKQLGLDDPIYVQYFRWVQGIARFDLGTSFITTRPVALDVGLRLPRTLMLIVPATVLGIAFGIPLGIAASGLRRTIWDPIISAVALLGFSVPVFVTGVLLVLVFAVHLGWLPSGGFVSPMDNFGGFLARATLPVIALAAGLMAITMRMTRSSMLEQLGLEYVRTAKSKGLGQRAVVFKHVLRNAMLPVVTIVGLQFGNMFAGSVLVETVFNWPGLSTLLIRSVQMRDYPIIQGIVLVVAAIFLLVNLITDLSYAFLDPRIRYE